MLTMRSFAMRSQRRSSICLKLRFTSSKIRSFQGTNWKTSSKKRISTRYRNSQRDIIRYRDWRSWRNKYSKGKCSKNKRRRSSLRDSLSCTVSFIRSKSRQLATAQAHLLLMLQLKLLKERALALEVQTLLALLNPSIKQVRP